MTTRSTTMVLATLFALMGCGSGEHDHGTDDHAGHGNPAAPATSDDDHAAHADHSDHAAHAAAGDPADHAAHAGHASVLQPAAPPSLPPGDSLFHIDSELSLVDQQGAPLTLRSLEGKPALITFFYGGCTTMCPLIVSDVRRTAEALSEAERAQVTVVLVTIDPATDTPERLRALALERSMPAEWRLVSGGEADIRTLASTLGMTYRAMPDGSFAHAALYTVLDRQGRIAHQLEGTGRPVEETAAAVRRVLADPS
jgi:protein SCO1/2